ncbi:MAG: Lrp/AsnC family transcriptional regulator [archaeon]|jgi:DNA-binding Lrp family transcriptional regulator|nr:AsnC family transcriptional regulator [Euryarchaeota archaeon]MDP6704473.1 Lrp/AsnC family transcriptional regulator [archaeon]HIK01049.1 Lrp/AsnC family transcriptional regulator [Candidatus Undinarchaeales archaeon ERR594346 U_76725]
MVICAATMTKLDDKDKKILHELQENCRQSSRDLSKKLDLPASTIHQRIKKLEKAGIISGYTAIVDPEKVGYNSSAIIFIEFSYHDAKKNNMSQETIVEKISKLPNVQEAHMVTGFEDIVIKVVGKTDRDIGAFVIKTLREIPGILKTKTGIILASSKDSRRISL